MRHYGNEWQQGHPDLAMEGWSCDNRLEGGSDCCQMCEDSTAPNSNVLSILDREYIKRLHKLRRSYRQLQRKLHRLKPRKIH